MKCTQRRWFRKLVIFWGITLLTALSIKVFWAPPDIPAGTAAAYGTAMGLFTGAVGLYEYLRDKEDKAAEAKQNAIHNQDVQD